MKRNKRGALSTVEHLSGRLLARWVPKWHEAFWDTDQNCFYERVNQHFKPILTGQRRLLTQCRLLATFSDASAYKTCRLKTGILTPAFENILDLYHVPETGGFIFSVDDDLNPLETHYDFYAQGFVIFAFSHYYRATGDERAQDYAQAVLGFIQENFKLEQGYAEALDAALNLVPGLRRHESHMHVLEGCLFAAETWPVDKRWSAFTDELVNLFFEKFYQAGGILLSEYYTGDLSPRGNEEGQIICEPGHAAEWIWLLKKHAILKGTPDCYDDTCQTLLDWAYDHGWDEEHGGIYDELDADGHIVQDTKRIWPFAEMLKASALMLDSAPDRDALKDRMTDMVSVFNDHYMQERGFWVEWLTRDLKPAVDYMPGTTPYHVYYGIMETLEALRARGASKSLTTQAELLIYRAKRKLSDAVRTARYAIKAKG